MKWLKGKKTYLASAASILGTLVGLASGQMVLVEAIQIIVPAILGATIRNGID